jgi:hypothetical protein
MPSPSVFGSSLNNWQGVVIFVIPIQGLPPQGDKGWCQEGAWNTPGNTSIARQTTGTIVGQQTWLQVQHD